MWQLDGPLELLECDEQVDVVRQGRGTPDDVQYIDGIPAATHPPVRQTVTATLQPMGGRDLMLVPEGFRDKETLWMWQAHRTAAQDTIRVDLADIVLYGRKGYQVQSSEDWGSYSRCMLVGIDLGQYAGLIAQATTPDVYPPTYLVEDPIRVGAIPLGDQMANYLYDAHGLPADNLGNPGDLYLDLDTYIVYGPKLVEGWPSTGKSLMGPPGKDGKDGKNGARGNYIFKGRGAPSPQILANAVAGDLYIDEDASTMYPLQDSLTGEIPFNDTEV